MQDENKKKAKEKLMQQVDSLLAVYKGSTEELTSTEQAKEMLLKTLANCTGMVAIGYSEEDESVVAALVGDGVSLFNALVSAMMESEDVRSLILAAVSFYQFKNQ